MTKWELSIKVWELHMQGVPTYLIAQKLNITEYEVIKILQKY